MSFWVALVAIILGHVVGFGLGWSMGFEEGRADVLMKLKNKDEE